MAVRLEDVAGGAGDDRFDHAVLFGAGEDQRARGGASRPSCSIACTPELSETQVHQHDIGAYVDDEPEGSGRWRLRRRGRARQLSVSDSRAPRISCSSSTTTTVIGRGRSSSRVARASSGSVPDPPRRLVGRDLPQAGVPITRAGEDACGCSRADANSPEGPNRPPNQVRTGHIQHPAQRVICGGRV